MIIFKLDPKQLADEDKKENLEKLKQILVKFHEADQELERVCKELGIPKPEIVCVQEEPIFHG